MPEFNVHGYAESPYCAQCPCAKNGKPQKAVRAFGGTGGLCIVGEGPGAEESSQGFPFIGPSGKIVNKALHRAGADRGRVWITNALLCKRPQNEDDFNYAVECCRARLESDLALGQPTAICALGGTAMRALMLPVTFVSQARGTVQYSPLIPDVPVIGALHPAALLHGGAGEMKGGKQKMNVDAQALFLYSDIAKTFQVAQGKVDPKWSDDIQVVHEAVDVLPVLEALFKDVYEWGILGIDLEWICEGHKNALDALGAGAHMARITWVGLGCATRSVSFKWDALVEAEGAFAYIQQVMEDENLPKLSHNKQADKAVWEAQVGPVKGRYFDTMLAHHAVCPGIDHDLQQVVSQYLCVPPWKVDHANAIKAHEEKQRAEAKVAKAIEREAKKATRIANHNAGNAEKKAKKEAEKAARIAAHEARNAGLAAEKKARKKKSKAEPVPFVRQTQQQTQQTLPQVLVHGIPYEDHPDPAADEDVNAWREDEGLPF